MGLADGGGTVVAQVPASAYVQSGLIGLWDGKENSLDANGNPCHDGQATTWVNLATGEATELETFTTANDTWTDNAYCFGATTSRFKFAPNGLGGEWTVQFRMTDNSATMLDSSDDKIWWKWNAGIKFEWRGSTRPTLSKWTSGETLTVASAPEWYGVHQPSAGWTKLEDALGSKSYGKWVGVGKGADGDSPTAGAKYYSIRVYDHALTYDEMNQNDVVDRFRFGTPPDGYRWNDAEGRIEYAVRVMNSTSDGGTVTVDDTDIGVRHEAWHALGTACTSTIKATPKEGYRFVRWDGDDGILTTAERLLPVLTLNASRALSLTAVFYADSETAVRYYPLEYVEGKGAQWVNTEQTLKCGQTFRILWSQNPEITYSGAGCNGAWGADTYAHGWQGAGYKQSNGYAITAYHNGYNGFSPEFNSGNFVLGDLYEDVCRVDADCFGYTMHHVGDGNIGSITPLANAEGEAYETTTPVYLLRNSVTTSNYMSYKRVHLATLFNTLTGTGVFNLVPVEREEDQDDGSVVKTVMLYDTVSGAGVTNMTKTALIAGPRTTAGGARWNVGKMELATSVSVSGDGTLTVNGGPALAEADVWTACGGTVTLRATPNAGSAFLGWGGEIGFDNRFHAEITLTVDRARKIVARFAPAGEENNFWMFSSRGELEHSASGINLKARVGMGNVTVQGVNSLADQTTVDLDRPIYLQDLQMPLTLTTISANAFKQNATLQHFKMPDTVTTIGSSAFYGCPSLVYVRVSQNLVTLSGGSFQSIGSSTVTPFFYPEPFLPPTLTSIGGSAFKFCYLTNDTVVLNNPNLTTWPSEPFSRVFMRVLDARDCGVTAINESIVYNDTKMEEVYLPKGLTSISATANVFGNCGKIKGIYISGKPISFAAANCFSAMGDAGAGWYLPKWDKDWEAYLADPEKALRTEMTAAACVDYATKHGNEAMPVESLKMGTPSPSYWVSGSKPIGIRWWYPNPPPKYEEVNYFDILGWEKQQATASADDAKLFDGTIWTASPKQTDLIWLGAAGTSVTYELGEACVNTRALKLTGYRLHQACIKATDVKPIVQMMPNGRAPTAWTLEGRLSATGEWVTLDEVVMTDSSANHWAYLDYGEYSEDVPPRANCSLTYAIPVAKQDSYSAFRFTPTHSHNTDNDIADATPIALMEIEFLGMVTTAEPRIDSFEQSAAGWNDLKFEGVVSGLGDNAAKGEHASAAWGWAEVADDDAFTENVRRSAEQSVSVNAAQQYAVSYLAGNTNYFARLVVSNDLGAVAYKALGGKAATLDAPWDAAQPVCSFAADSNVVVTVNFAGVYVPGGVRVKIFGTPAVGGAYTWLVDRNVTEAGETAIPTGFKTDSPSSCVKVVVEADGISREYIAGVRPFWVANAAASPTSISNIVVGTTFSVTASGTDLTLATLVDLGATTEIDLSTPVCSADGTTTFAVKSVGTALKGNADVTALVLPDAMTEIPANAFNSCYGLQRIHLPTGLEKIGSYVFYQCAVLSEIDPCLPQNCTNFGSYAFEYCTALMSVSIPEGTTKLAQSLFHGCTKLGEASLPESLTELTGGAFWECTALSNVWPRPIPHNVTAIGVRTYKFCQKLSVNLQPKILVADSPGTLTLNEESLNRTYPQVVDFGGCAGLKLLGNSSLTTGDSGRTDFRRLVLPPSVDCNGFAMFSDTSGCGGVTNITFMGYPPENIVSDPFAGASKAMYVVPSNSNYDRAWRHYLEDHPTWAQEMTAEDRAAFRKSFPGERYMPKVKLQLGGVGPFRYLQRLTPRPLTLILR